MHTLNVQSVYTIAIYIPIQLIVLDAQIPDSTYAISLPNLCFCLLTWTWALEWTLDLQYCEYKFQLSFPIYR